MVTQRPSRIVTYKEICDLEPCYDPIEHIPKDYVGTLIDILQMENVPPGDRLWVCVRSAFMSELQLKHFGLAVARSCEQYATDERVKLCNDAVENYLAGKASLEEVRAARSAARSAAWSAAESAAESAAWSAARSAARSAAESAAESAAWSAARSAACKLAIKVLQEIP